LWGEVLAVVLAGGLVAPLSGQGPMGLATGNLRFTATTVLMHTVWGVLIGVIYTGAR
jgi:hypothetical protein